MQKTYLERAAWETARAIGIDPFFARWEHVEEVKGRPWCYTFPGHGWWWPARRPAQPPLLPTFGAARTCGCSILCTPFIPSKRSPCYLPPGYWSSLSLTRRCLDFSAGVYEHQGEQHGLFLAMFAW